MFYILFFKLIQKKFTYKILFIHVFKEDFLSFGDFTKEELNIYLNKSKNSIKNNQNLHENKKNSKESVADASRVCSFQKEFGTNCAKEVIKEKFFNILIKFVTYTP